jgi:hypothetical protein
MFFQTVTHRLGIGNCSTDGCLRYIDWNTGPEFPRTLRREDFEKISQSNALFARKLDERLDPNLIELLYESLT